MAWIDQFDKPNLIMKIIPLKMTQKICLIKNILKKIEYKDRPVIEKTSRDISQNNIENETTFLSHLQWNSHADQVLLTLHVNASFI